MFGATHHFMVLENKEVTLHNADAATINKFKTELSKISPDLQNARGNTAMHLVCKDYIKLEKLIEIKKLTNYAPHTSYSIADEGDAYRFEATYSKSSHNGDSHSYSHRSSKSYVVKTGKFDAEKIEFLKSLDARTDIKNNDGLTAIEVMDKYCPDAKDILLGEANIGGEADLVDL